nr:putative oxidoreductase ordl [Quercus suber]
MASPQVDTSSSDAHQGPFPVSNATVPYWRCQLHPIDEYRSTVDLPAECDIAIIGAGMSGVAAAYHISQISGFSRPSMVMLEAREVCSGATGRNGGHVKIKSTSQQNLVRKVGLPAANQFSAMVQRVIHGLQDVVKREKLDCEFELRRTVDAFLDTNDAYVVERQWFKSVEAGEAWTRELDFVPRSRAEQVTSITGTKIALTSTACSLWPYKFVTQLLAKLVQRQELHLQTNTPVLKLTHNPDSSTSLCTERGIIRAKRVIFATNAYTSGLLQQFKSTIIPTKITATHISPSKPLIIPHLSNTYNIFYEQPDSTCRRNDVEIVDYLNPRPDGTIVVGGGSWTYKSDTDKDMWWNNWDDSTLFPCRSTREHFDRLMPTHFRGWGSSGARIDSIWTGITGTTADGAPFVGKLSGMGDTGTGAQGWVLAGYNGGGMATIWACAEAVAKMIVHGRRRKIRCVWSANRTVDTDVKRSCEYCLARGRLCVPQQLQPQLARTARTTAHERLSYLEQKLVTLTSIVQDKHKPEAPGLMSPDVFKDANDAFVDVATEFDQTGPEDSGSPSHLRMLFDNFIGEHKENGSPARDGNPNQALEGMKKIARVRLQPLLPTHEDIVQISDHASRWMNLYCALFPVVSAIRTGDQMIRNHDRVRHAHTEPVELAIYLLSVAITAQQVPQNKLPSSFGDTQNLSKFVNTVCQEVESTIISSSALVGTTNGVEAALLQVRLCVNCP